MCPFLRREDGDRLAAPWPVPDAAHRCLAIGDPAPQSHRQQQLVCLQPVHANCPRYLRGAVAVAPAGSSARVTGRVPTATLASLVFLVLAAGVSFGFVLQRGSLDLAAAAPTPEPSVAIVATPAPSVVPTDGPTAPPASSAPSATPPAATPEPSVSGEPSTPAPSSEPSTTPGATPAPTSDRYASLQPCPDQDDCWIYVVQAGNNLFSIAAYYGHPLATILEWNPWISDPSIIRAGDEIRMPPPTR